MKNETRKVRLKLQEKNSKWDSLYFHFKFLILSPPSIYLLPKSKIYSSYIDLYFILFLLMEEISLGLARINSFGDLPLYCSSRSKEAYPDG